MRAVVPVLVVLAAVAWVVWLCLRPPTRPPGSPARRPVDYWPQEVTVTHQVHVWHHVVDDRPPVGGRVVPGEIVPGAPPALPPTRRELR